MAKKINLTVSGRNLAIFLACLTLAHLPIVHASPLSGTRALDVIDVKMFRRQDPGPQSAQDPSGIEPEDEDPAQILADGTDALRSGKKAISLCLYMLGTYFLISCICSFCIHQTAYGNLVPSRHCHLGFSSLIHLIYHDGS